MSEPHTSSHINSPYPNAESVAIHSARSVDINNSHSPSSSSSVSSSSETERNPHHSNSSSRRLRMERPTVGDRQMSSSIIIPKGADTYQREKPNYPPTDARAMSPRRSSVDLEKLERSARQSLKEKARTLQSSLAALAERIDEVRSDHDKLESENKFLQDYIGGLTRTMSGSGLGRSGSTAKKGKK